MATCLHGHQASISLAASMVTNVIDNELRHTKLAMFMQKSGGQFLPAKETTMVSSSLDMMGAIRSALELCCPLRASKVDVVLQSLVPMIAKKETAYANGFGPGEAFSKNFESVIQAPIFFAPLSLPFVASPLYPGRFVHF